MCEPSKEVESLCRFFEMEWGVEQMGREPMFASGTVAEKIKEEYECDCDVDNGWLVHGTMTLQTW